MGQPAGAERVRLVAHLGTHPHDVQPVRRSSERSSTRAT
jgi:hypothetical protein